MTGRLDHEREDGTRKEGLPPAVFEHQEGSWSWRVFDVNQPERREVEVYVSAPTGVVCVEAGFDPVELDEAAVRGLILCLNAAYARCWGGER